MSNHTGLRQKKKIIDKIKNLKAIKKHFGWKVFFKYLFVGSNTQKRRKLLIETSNEFFHEVLEKNKNQVSTKNSLPKKIYLMWYQGYDNAPNLVKLCRKSVEHFYSDDHKIEIIDKENISSYISPNNHIYRLFKEGKISIQIFSDYLRMTILYERGGTWIDSTVLFLSKIDLNKYIGEGSFGSINNEESNAFCIMDGFKCTEGCFFMQSRPNSVISSSFIECYDYYFSKAKYPFSYMLTDFVLASISLHHLDNDTMNKIPFCEGSIYIGQKYGLKELLKQAQKGQINNFQKMDWRMDVDEIDLKSLEDYITSL